MNETVLNSAYDATAIRGHFPIFAKPLPKGLPLVYLDSASSAQKPLAVIDKEREVYEQYYANAYRGVYRFGAMVDDALERTRGLAQQLLNAAEPEEIIFTNGSTMALNLIAYAWGMRQLKAGDEILLNEMEHHANLVPWQQVAERTGAACRFLPLTSDGRLDMTQLDQFLTERTKLVAVTGISNVLGTVNPIRELAHKAHECGALIVVDGAQSVPHSETDVRELDVDFLVFSGHKIYGPSGVGVLYGRREILESMDPFLFGGHMIDRVYRDKSTWAELPAKFEAGTLPIAQAVGLGAAIEYVNEIGISRMHAHEQSLLAEAHRQLSEIPGMKIYGPPIDAKGAIVSFTIDRAHPEDLAQLLDRCGVFVRHGHHCTMPLHDLLGVSATIRASFGCYNRIEDVTALADGLRFALGKLRLI